METIARQIEDTIVAQVENSEFHNRFRRPIVGFASADDPLYNRLDEIIGVPQIHPKEMLAGAKTVVVYFLPFSLERIEKLREDRLIVPEWSEDYTNGNLILSQMNRALARMLTDNGYAVRTEPPTCNYDTVELTAKWAHKASAVIAGIGTFGLNHLLITKSGTAGRLNSIVTSCEIPPTKRPSTSYCLYYQKGICKVCVEKCPSGALSEDGFDRFRCNAYLDGKNIHDLQQGCGMCSSGPCAGKGFFTDKDGGVAK